MNGISVMACVQADRPGFSAVYGKETRMQQKYIKISCQREKKDSAAYTVSAAAAVTAGASVGRNCKREAVRPAQVRRTRRASQRRAAFAARSLVLAVIFAGMLAGFQMMTRASSRAQEQTYKYYTTVTIGYGEDLSDIIYRYCDSNEYENADAYLKEICEINSLPYHEGEVNDLRAGTKIVIPYYSTELK
ncbi:MAG: hypothetical protein J6E41_11395 [Lachnospiraceae bacterium]|nr:hypothetical protein [Lachnospiraceae bacterium]